jgi:hypothetical protein
MECDLQVRRATYSKELSRTSDKCGGGSMSFRVKLTTRVLTQRGRHQQQTNQDSHFFCSFCLFQRNNEEKIKKNLSVFPFFLRCSFEISRTNKKNESLDWFAVGGVRVVSTPLW